MAVLNPCQIKPTHISWLVGLLGFCLVFGFCVCFEHNIIESGEEFFS